MVHKVLKNMKTMPLQQIILLIIMGIGLCKLMTYMSTERFSEIDVSHGDIQFYGRDSCPFCVKMKKLLQESPDLNAKIEHIDVETPEGSAKFKKVNASGVPHFECKSTGKSTSGYQPVEKLLDNLGLS